MALPPTETLAPHRWTAATGQTARRQAVSTEPELEYVDGPPWMGSGDSESPVWTADSEDPAERMEREEREAYEALKAADDANPREAWEPFLSEHELAIVERALLVFTMALMHGETGEVQWAAMGAARAAELYAMLGGRAALIEWLSEIGPRLSLLQVRMATGQSKGLFEPPF